MDYKSFMDLVTRRRSVWDFRADPVPNDYIEKIVDAARYAPSAVNSQLWEFVAVGDQELRDGITGIIASAMPGAPVGQAPPPGGAPVKDPLGFKTAPMFILVLGDPRVRAFCPPHIQSDDAYWASASTISLAAAYEHMHLAAASLGLSTRWVSAVARPAVAPKIKELLGIPEELWVFEMMALGFSDFQPKPKQMRPLSEVLHFDRCSDQDFRTEEQIGAFFGRR
jgi:nitroreductase